MDVVDQASNLIDASTENQIAVIRKRRTLLPTGRCYFCDSDIAMHLIFCDGYCRDDYEKRIKATEREGRTWRA